MTDQIFSIALAVFMVCLGISTIAIFVMLACLVYQYFF